MVTNAEQKVIDEYKKKGYCSVHCGAPDFIFYKTKGNPDKLLDIDMSSIEFAEVKYGGDTLSHEQQIWRHILKKLGLRYKLINIRKEQNKLNTIQINAKQDNANKVNTSQGKSNSIIHIRKEQNRIKQDKPSQPKAYQFKTNQSKSKSKQEVKKWN